MARISESEAQKEMAKHFGADSFFISGDDVIMSKTMHIRTGSPSLDEALGIGGIPRGRIVQLAGKESSGKTMLALSCIKNYLNENPENTAMFIDAEFTYDPDWATSLGVDTSRVMVVKSNEAKKIFDGLIGVPNPNSKVGKKKMRGVLDFVKEGTDPKFSKLGIIVLDSVAVLSTPQEEDSEAGKMNVASLARFLTVELKKLTPVLADTNVTFIGINQLRENIGVMYGPTTSSPGGRALKHACSVMIEMSPIGGSAVEDSEGVRIGHKVRASVAKNKVGKPFGKAEYSIEYVKGMVGVEEELLDMGIRHGIVGRPNNVMYEISGESFRGRSAAVEKVALISRQMEDTIREHYINKVKVQIQQDDSDEDFSEEENALLEDL
jgi:recombination protein RecA